MPAIRYSAVEARRVPVGSLARSVVWALPALVLVAALAWPLFLSDSSFSDDWLSQVWFMWKQSTTIAAGHLPSLFLNYPHGVFYPHFAFYGGTLYALTGALSVALGDAPFESYAVAYTIACAAAYGGWYWGARMAGLGRWWAQAPGLLFVTSSYYLTLIYGRGDLPEFVGVSMIPLMVAAGLSVLRAGSLRLWPALGLAGSVLLFFASHILTMLWGCTFLALVGLAIVVGVPQARKEITRAGVIRVARVLIPAALISAWFLLPASAYESDTYIANRFLAWERWLRSTMPLVSMRHLFTLSRATTSTPGSDFPLSLPILAMAWVVVGIGAALRDGLRDPWTRVLLIASLFAVAFTVLLTHAGLILALPQVYATLQFSYRLESYALLSVSGAVLAALVLAHRRPDRLWTGMRWAIPPILVVAVIGAVQQVAAYPVSSADRQASLAAMRDATAATERTIVDYIDVKQPAFSNSKDARPSIEFDTTQTQDNRISTVAHLPAGSLADSNLMGPPSLVDVQGARIVGFNSTTGGDVLEVRPPPSAPGRGTPAAEQISVTPSASLPVVLGRVLSICAALVLVLQLVWVAARRRASAS